MTSASKYLLLVTLGPVQDFIAQSRRTRDLWFGSHVLSELSRAGARQLVELGAELVFPSLNKGHEELEPCDQFLRRTTGQPPLNVANRLLAVVDGTENQAGSIAKEVRKAIRDHWLLIAEKTRKECAAVLAPGVDDVWREQIETFLEFNAAWAPLGSGEAEYHQSRMTVEKAIAGRKNLRDFDAWHESRGAVPKSTLDGARETVIRKKDQGFLRGGLQVAAGEQLDAIGLIKRAGGNPEQFIPIANVAFSSWLDRAATECPELLSSVSKACQDVRLGQVRRGLECTKSFRYDAQIFMESRWESIFEDFGIETPSAKEWGEKVIRPLLKKLRGEPSPYVACLVADGDGMGKAIGNIKSAKGHREFSSKLSEFAGKAREIVEQKHRGALVYSGGDDVLAFVCMSDALETADALRRSFEELLQEYATPEGRPTLSVGLGVGHVLDGMAHLLELGRKAERLAKGQSLSTEERRNALAVIVDKRSGGIASWRARWESDPLSRAKTDIQVWNSGLSHKKVFEIRGDLKRMPQASDLLDEAERTAWSDLLVADVRRTLARSGTHEGEDAVTPEVVGLGFSTSEKFEENLKQANQWVDRMLVIRMFAEAIRLGKQGGHA